MTNTEKLLTEEKPKIHEVKEFTLSYNTQNILIRYYSGRNLIKCIGGIHYDRTFQFIQELIISRDIGIVDSIIYYTSPKNNVVWLIRGENINSVLRKTPNSQKKDKLSFSEILKRNI